MSLLAHITYNEVAFIVGVYLFGLASGLLVAQRMQRKTVEKDRER